MAIIMYYDSDNLKRDLTELGLLNQEEDRRVLMTLLDGCFEAWVDHLLMTADILIDILPNRTVRRTTEITSVFGGKVAKIQNLRTCTWRDYNGDHYFTKELLIQANSCGTISSLLADFRGFIRISGLDLLKEKTKNILPAWSVAFVHRMPQQVQSFYFPGI